MKQRIITVFSVFQNDGFSNLDSLTKKLESEGYVVKQIVSTALEGVGYSERHRVPRLAITLLVEKRD